MLNDMQISDSENTISSQQLRTELQSVGLRLMQTDIGVKSRRGGAGPSDHKAVTIDGVTIMVPVHTNTAWNSPFLVETEDGTSTLKRGSHIEFIAVQNQVAFANGIFVDGITADFNAAKIHAAVVSQAVVVIAGNENDARALAGLAQKLLQHIIVGLWPMRAALDLPEIDDIANEVIGFSVRIAKKIKKRFGLAIAHSQMHVGYKNCAV